MSISGTRSASTWSRRLVTLLTEQGAITSDGAESALSEAAERSTTVSTVLAQRGLADPRVVLAELARLAGVESVDIFEERPMADAFKLVPEMVARENGAIGYRLEHDRLTLASSEPLSNEVLRGLSAFLGCEIAGYVLADPIGIERIMDTVYPRLAGGAGAPVTAPTDWSADGAPAGGRTDVGSVQQGTLMAPPPPPPPPPPASGVNGATGGDAAVMDSAQVRPVAAYPEGVATYESTGGGDDEPETTTVPNLDLDSLLTYAVENGASDLHLTNQLPPTIRVDGSLRPIEGLPRLDNEQIREMIFRILTQNLRERFEATKELDTAHTIYGVGRFRVNVFQQRGSVGAVLRAIPHDIPAFESLGLPDVVAGFAELRRGLVLVTGPTGSGKSTSLASLVNIINKAKSLHIMTVEDPIEFIHSHQRAIVNQREVGYDTESFSEALRHVLRQDPDVILVGEMRDLETISTALTAAETGHLVFATLHTQDAPQTIDRIIDVFPTSQQDQVRIQLAGCLEAVVTQQLIIGPGGHGRVAVAEVMVCSPAIRNLIRSAKTHQIYSLMQTGSSQGMQTMDQSLAKAVKARRITEAVAYDRCHDPAELRDHLKG
jgi:twitching motility protein PilT